MPAVSVVMPVHNAMPFLPAALESIRNQSLRDLEIIVCDDASTDGSGAYLDGVRDERLRVYHRPKEGLPRQLNFGLREARAPLVARMDGDDRAAPDRLAWQLRHLEQHPAVGACGGQAVFVDADDRVLGDQCYDTDDAALKCLLPYSVPFPHPSVMFRRELVLRVGGYDTNLVTAEDYELWWRLAPHCRFANAPDVFLYYRTHATSMTQRHQRWIDELCADAVARHLGMLDPAIRAENARLLHHVLKEHVPFEARQAGPCLAVLQRYLPALVAAGWVGPGDLPRMRQRLRWLFLNRAHRCGWHTRAGRNWLWLAFRIDPGEMRWWRLAPRALRQGWHRLRGGFSTS